MKNAVKISKKSFRLYYTILGGGENIFLEILSCFDKFLERIKLPSVVLFNSKVEVIASIQIIFLTSFLACSSSDTLKNTAVSVDFSISLIMVGVDKKATKRNKKKRATNFIETKINLKKYKLHKNRRFFKKINIHKKATKTTL